MTSEGVGRLLRAAVVAAAAVGLVGCGKSGPTRIPVSGRVTVDGQKVPGPGFIYFNPTGEGKEEVSRPATAEFDADGNYEAKTFEPGDGLLPGKYVLRVDCWKQGPNMDGKPVVSFIAQKYQNAAKSELSLSVPSDSRPITFAIDLKSK
jgi:predicted small lipoprotein YifL